MLLRLEDLELYVQYISLPPSVSLSNCWKVSATVSCQDSILHTDTHSHTHTHTHTHTHPGCPSSCGRPCAAPLGSPPPGSALLSVLGQSVSYTGGAAAQRHRPTAGGGTQVAK